MNMMLQRLGDSDQVKFSSKGDELVYLHVYIASYIPCQLKGFSSWINDTLHI